MNDRRAIAGVRVIAPARLHLGFLDLNGNMGRRYGSIGLAIDHPATEVRVRRASAWRASGAESDRALKIMKRAADALNIAGAYEAEVQAAIPAHAGLGSGTQLAIAIGAALMHLEGLNVSAHKLGDIAGRGARSAIGMAAFERGGFIIDGGRGELDQPPPVLVQTPFPEDWRAILVFDKNEQGAYGDREAQAFAALPHFPDELSAKLCRLVLMQLLPGLMEADIRSFGAALTGVQEIVGNHFASAQGGSPWTSPAVGQLVRRLSEGGATGVGQTSWGPTGFAFISSEDAAQRLYHSLVEEAKAMGLEMMVVRGRNSGALVETF